MASMATVANDKQVCKCQTYPQSLVCFHCCVEDQHGACLAEHFDDWKLVIRDPPKNCWCLRYCFVCDIVNLQHWGWQMSHCQTACNNKANYSAAIDWKVLECLFPRNDKDNSVHFSPLHLLRGFFFSRSMGIVCTNVDTYKIAPLQIWFGMIIFNVFQTGHILSKKIFGYERICTILKHL